MTAVEKFGEWLALNGDAEGIELWNEAYKEIHNQKIDLDIACKWNMEDYKERMDERKLHDLWIMGNCRMSFSDFKTRIFDALQKERN